MFAQIPRHPTRTQCKDCNRMAFVCERSDFEKTTEGYVWTFFYECHGGHETKRRITDMF